MELLKTRRTGYYTGVHHRKENIDDYDMEQAYQQVSALFDCSVRA